MTLAAAASSSNAVLILAALLGIATVVVMITWLKVHPFLALILGSAVLGLVAGLGPTPTVDSFTKGVGSTVGSVGLLIALGAMIGALLADSGGADRIVQTIVDRVSPGMLPWAMAGAAALVGIPLFFEVGVVLLVPIVLLVGRRTSVPLLKVGIPALAGLSVLHGFVPPHPGPLVAIAALKADLGLTLALGLLVAIPCVIIAGPIFGSFISRYVSVPWPLFLGGREGATMSASAELAAQENPDAEDRRALRASTGRERDGRRGGTADLDRDGVPDRLEGDRLQGDRLQGDRLQGDRLQGDRLQGDRLQGDRLQGDRLEGDRLEGDRPLRRPGFAPAVLTILLPVILMLARAIAEIMLEDGSRLQAALVVVGNPVVALLTGVIVAMFTLGVASGMDRYRISASTGGALSAIAGILLIVAAGGGFKQTLIDSGVGNVIADAAEGANISALVLGWLVAVGIRLATGSATVATITAAGIVAPLAAGMDRPSVALLVLAIGAGSLFFSHVNDAGFWLVKEYFGMTVGQTIKTWSIMETIISVVGIAVVLLLNLVL